MYSINGIISQECGEIMTPVIKSCLFQDAHSLCMEYCTGPDYRAVETRKALRFMDMSDNCSDFVLNMAQYMLRVYR